MSAPPTPGVSSSPPPLHALGRVRQFWQRVSEGRQIDELWSQFTADARASYGFYMKEADSEELEIHRGFKRWFRIAKTLVWSLLMKMTPARRVLLLVAFVMLVMSGVKLRVGQNFAFDMNFEVIAVFVFLLLLSLELADKVTMKRDLEIAREIQSWLVPSQPPVVGGANIAFHTRPQNSVAGDYYDAFYPLNDAAQGGKLFLAIADVAGKSVPAALLMATFQASLHTVARNGVPLGELVLRLNRYACAHSFGGMRFTTAVLAEYDPVTRRLDYINAGHNAPVVRRANANVAGANSGIERLDASGVPFGISLDATYEVG